MKKEKKKENSVQESIQLCAHPICTVDGDIITWQVADQGSKGPTGSQVISLHIYVQIRSITVKTLPRCIMISRTTAVQKDKHSIQIS